MLPLQACPESHISLADSCARARRALRLRFAGLDEREIACRIAILADVLRIEMRRRQRGTRRAEMPHVALIKGVR